MSNDKDKKTIIKKETFGTVAQIKSPKKDNTDNKKDESDNQNKKSE
jgi:hypothetical protein